MTKMQGVAAALRALADAMDEVDETPPAAPAAGKSAGKGKAKSTVTLEQLKEKLSEVIKAKGRDTAVGILKKHKAAKLGELDEAEYAGTMEDAEKALTESEEEL